MENQKKRVIDEEERPAIGQGDARPMRRRVQIFFFFCVSREPCDVAKIFPKTI